LGTFAKWEKIFFSHNFFIAALSSSAEFVFVKKEINIPSAQAFSKFFILSIVSSNRFSTLIFVLIHKTLLFAYFYLMFGFGFRD